MPLLTHTCIRMYACMFIYAVVYAPVCLFEFGIGQFRDQHSIYIQYSLSLSFSLSLGIRSKKKGYFCVMLIYIHRKIRLYRFSLWHIKCGWEICVTCYVFVILSKSVHYIIFRTHFYHIAFHFQLNSYVWNVFTYPPSSKYRIHNKNSNSSVGHTSELCLQFRVLK